MERFKSWEEVLEHIRDGGQLYYHAPLDARPLLVRVAKIYKNGKIRIDPMTRDADPFTADRGHLDRMRKVPRVTCAGCGERFPCSDSDRRDIDPIERAKHFAKEV